MGEMSRSLSQNSFTSTEEESDSTCGQRLAKPLCRSGSTGTAIEHMTMMTRKASLTIHLVDTATDDHTGPNKKKNAQWGVLSEPEATATTGGAVVHQQSCDSASCFAVVNEIRTKHALKSLQRDKSMDDKAQKHAKGIAKSNGNYVVTIDYVAHVLHGLTVIEMHHATMNQQLESPSKIQTNILNPDFQVMGVGVAKGTNNGLLYVCELFHGKFTLCCSPDDLP